VLKGKICNYNYCNNYSCSFSFSNNAGIIGKSFGKAFTKYNVGKVFIMARIYPQSENDLDESEFLLFLADGSDSHVVELEVILSDARTTPPMRK
jgi:hypothetical protein